MQRDTRGINITAILLETLALLKNSDFKISFFYN